MAIHHSGNLESLILELERRGLRVKEARHSGAFGAGTDLCLTNGALIRFEPEHGTLWTSGPVAAVRRVNAELRREPGVFTFLRDLLARTQPRSERKAVHGEPALNV